MTYNVSGTKARQGRSGKRVLAILIASIAGAIAVWLAVAAYSNSVEPETSAIESTEPNAQARVVMTGSDQSLA